MERSRPALIALIALSWAGCFSDRGIAIEVSVGDTGATSVELYVGNSPCSDHKDAKIRCGGGIAPPNVNAHLTGKVWFRDDEAPYRAPVVDGKATFRLEASADTRLPIVIAVGSGGDPATTVATATLTDVLVPAKSARVITTQLAPAGQVQPTSNATGDDRVQVWSEPEPAGGRTCVVVEHSANGEMTRNFIVPASDPDCDSEKPECDPAAAHGKIQMDGIDRAPDCYAGAPDAADEPCKLGARRCVDGSLPSGMCYTTFDDICVPKALCNCPGPTASDACPADKLADPLSPEVPHLFCLIPIPARGSTCKVADSGTIHLSHLSADCKQPILSSFSLAELADGDRSHSFNGIDLEVARLDNQCGFKVQVNSGRHVTPGQELGMLRLQVDQHAVLLPIVFRFEEVPCLLNDPAPHVSCNEIPALETGPPDPMWSCVP